MHKNSLTLVLGLLAVFSISPTTYAANKKPTQRQVNTHEKHFFVELGSSYENFQLPKFGMASAGVSGKQSPLVTANSTKNVFIPELKFGFNFNNYFLTSIFGPHASAYIDVSGFNSKSSTFQADVPNGAIWSIAGGRIGSGSTAHPLANFKFNSNTKYRNVGLYFQGQKALASKINSQLFIGAIYTNLKQNYDASIDFNAGGQPWWTNDIAETLNTKYYGLSFGNNLIYHFTPKLRGFTNITLQLLYAAAKLNATQHPFSKTQPYYKIQVTDDNNTFTYRTKATVGLNYAFTKSISSPTLRFAVGIDQWGYVPGVHNPKGNGDTQAAHIVGHSYWNPFANVSLRVPF